MDVFSHGYNWMNFQHINASHICPAKDKNIKLVMDKLHYILGYLSCMVNFIYAENGFSTGTPTESHTENQAFKAAVSSFVISSQVSADLFILPQALAVALKQEYLHFHSEGDVALKATKALQVVLRRGAELHKQPTSLPFFPVSPTLPRFKITRSSLTSEGAFFCYHGFQQVFCLVLHRLAKQCWKWKFGSSDSTAVTPAYMI